MSSLVTGADAIVMGPNKYLEVSSTGYFTEKPEINSSSTAETKSLSGWLALANSKISGLTLSAKAISPGQQKVIAIGKKPGPGNYIKFHNNTASLLGFKYGHREAKSPEGHHLCFSPGSGEISMKPYYAKCSGHLIRKDQMLGSKAARALLTIIDQPAMTLIDLPN